ncbi:MAG: recombinase A [bacterium ADurb.BinA186]|nr:MAG: recombinase A [bacterium ADurb.BinA186]
MAPPFKEVEFDIIYGQGIVKEGELLDLGVQCGAIEKSGSWFSYGKEKMGQGRENVGQFLREHPEIALEIENRIRTHYNLPLAKGASVNGKNHAKPMIQASA